MEEKKSEEALLIVQKTYDLWGYQNERDEARRLPEIWKLKKGEEGDGCAALFLFGVVQIIDGGSRRRDDSGVSEKEAGGTIDDGEDYRVFRLSRALSKE